MSQQDNRYNTIPIKGMNVSEIVSKHQNETLVRFVHISDTHISADPNYNLGEAAHRPMDGARELVRQINNLPFEPDFVIHTGDVAYDPDISAYEKAKEILSEIKYPVYYLIGNHDDRDMLQRVMFGVEQPRNPFYYEFEFNGVQFVCLDSNAPAKFAGGAVSIAQLEWLDKICRASDNRPLVVCVHHNVLPIGAPFWDEFMRMTNGEEFHRVLLNARSRIRGVFFGHVHMSADTYRDGILYSSVLSSWYQLHCYPGQQGIEGDTEADPGFNVVSVSRAQTFIRRHRFKVAKVAER